MGRVCRRGLVMLAVVSVIASVQPSATAAPTAKPASQSAFIEALSAIPAAVEALATAREELQTTQAQHAAAQVVADSVRGEFSAATDELHERILVRTRAELAAARAQEDVDDAARQMYSSGGDVPTLVDVMLTAESEDALMRSLVTRQYLSVAADARVQTGAWAIGEAARAEEGRAEAEVVRDMAASAWKTASTDLATATTELTAAQQAVEKARKKYKKLMKITGVDRSGDYGRIKKCGDWLTKLLSKAGFKGENLREAWAIVMRESGGRADAVSVSNDLGLFQINTATWQNQPWFDRENLLKKKYNASVGFLLSNGGDSWYSWGLDGHGRPQAQAYVNAGWSQERIVAKIIEPYVLWYARYPCRPAYEQNTWLSLPIDIAEASKPRAEDTGEEPLAAGGGRLPAQPGGPQPFATGPPTASPVPSEVPPTPESSPPPTPVGDPTPSESPLGSSAP